MERRDLENILDKLLAGEVSKDDVIRHMQVKPLEDLGYANVDHHRGLRQGISEVVYGEGKTAEQIAGIVGSMLGAGQKRILITRLDSQKAVEVNNLVSEGSRADGECRSEGSKDASSGVVFSYNDIARVGTFGAAPKPDGKGKIAIVCGGTSDLFVAEEAAITAEMLGNEVVRIYDVGVAGLHRLLAHAEELMGARVVIAIAGMEGALASVVGGLVSCPVLAVPTSVGYGASLGGVAALLSMLNSCASGVSVVNIDNGFGAAYQASLINHL